MSTRLSTRAQAFLAQYATPFGGVDAVLKLLPDAEIEKILTFSGRVYVVKPWSCAIDLQEYGYTPGTPYNLLDNRLAKIGTYYSADGYFGTSLSDQELLLRVDHGSLMYLQTQDTLLMLWVCNKLSPSQIRDQIDRWQKATEQYKRQLVAHELFIYTNRLLPNDELQISHVPGVWSRRLTPAEVRAEAPEISVHQGSDEIISIFLQTTGWYLFELVRGAERWLLELTQLRGVGVNKLRQASTGVYFITLAGNQRTALRPSITNFPTNQQSLRGQEPYIRIEGEVKLKDPDLLLGQAEAEVAFDVLTELKHYPVNGVAQVRSHILPSLRSTVDGVATTNPVNFIISEQLILAGVAPAIDLDFLRLVTVATRSDGVATVEIDALLLADAELEGTSAVDADNEVRTTMGTQYQAEYETDPLELLLFTGDIASAFDPLERLWYSTEYQPYLHQVPTTETTVNGRSEGYATANVS